MVFAKLKKFRDWEGSWNSYKHHLHKYNALDAKLISTLKPIYKNEQPLQQSLLDRNESEL